LLLITIAGLASLALAGFAFFRVTFDHGIPHLAARFDFREWLEQLPSHLPWVIPYMALTASLTALRAIVWGRTLPQPVGAAPEDRPPVPWRSRFHALALGGLVHNALPGHLGVFAASWVLARDGGPPLPAGLASLLLAKLLEFGALFSTTVALAALARLRGVAAVTAAPMLWAGGIALVVFVIALGGARRLAPRLGARLARRGKLPRLVAVLNAVAGGLVAVGSPRRLLAGWALAFMPVLAAALAFALALRHVGGESFLLGGGLLVGAVTFAQMTPGLPSSVGLYYFACTATARALGVPDEAAAALAALSSLASGATYILVGLAAAVARREGLRDILRVRAAVRESAAT
jgi:hypothetical protein